MDGNELTERVYKIHFEGDVVDIKDWDKEMKGRDIS